MSAANGALQKAPCPALAGPLGGPGACGAGVGGGTLVCVVSGGGAQQRCIRAGNTEQRDE